MQNISDMLDSDEKILWSGNPEFKPYIFSTSSITASLFGLAFLGFSLVFFITSILTIVGAFMVCFDIPFILIGLYITLTPLIRYYTYSKVEYAFTNKRVFMKSGLWATNFKTFDYEDINDLNVVISLADKYFDLNTGTIMISTGTTTSKGVSLFNRFEAITEPYKVFKQLKKVSLDIQTDIEYPNKLRPNKNPGYKTEYNSKDPS